LLDTLVSGSVLYWMIGLGQRSSASNFFIYLSILFMFASLMNQQMAMFASFATEAKLQVYSAITLFFFILFSGFIVPVDTIPPYYLFFYWINPFAWAYNALIVNEVYSGGEENPEAVLIANGFVTPEGDVFDTSWIGWSILYMFVYWGLCTVGTALGLTYWRAPTKASSAPKSEETIEEPSDDNEESDKLEIPFKPVTLSFEDLCYEVTASTSTDKLMLLKHVDGVFRPGRMCALMGTSGAG
jgi:ABC-type multidrug transport system fused ATPase/permease subunit